MAEPDKRPATLEAFLVSSLAQADALALLPDNQRAWLLHRLWSRWIMILQWVSAKYLFGIH